MRIVAGYVAYIWVRDTLKETILEDIIYTENTQSLLDLCVSYICAQQGVVVFIIIVFLAVS